MAWKLEGINCIREIARIRVESLNTKHGQRATSKLITVSGEFIRDCGLQVPLQVPFGFDYARDCMGVESRFCNNNGNLIATDYSIFKLENWVVSQTIDPQFVRFGLGEFMSDCTPPTKPVIDDLRVAIVGMDSKEQTKIYRWMHDALGCRI